MHRYNFLNRDSFLETNESTVHDSLKSLPLFAPHIRLIGENAWMESFRFSFSRPEIPIPYYIDVTVLKLNEQFVRVCLHATYEDGRIVEDERKMNRALADFESALQAAVKGDTSLYQSYFDKPEIRPRNPLAGLVHSAASLLLLRKKLS